MSDAAGTPSISYDPSPIDLRAKIIGILSDTANGCLTELGYFPGLLKKLQELEQTNAHWKKENIKLFHDNQTLAQLARYHVDRSKQPNSGNVSSLEEQVKLLTSQNAELKKKNEGLLASGSSQCSHVPYHQLLADYQQLTVLYRTAMAEIHHLRKVIQVNAGPRSESHSASSPAHPIRSADPRLLQEQHVHPLQVPSLFPGRHPPVADPRNAPYPGHKYIATHIAKSVNYPIASSIRPAPGRPNTMQGPVQQPYSIPNPMTQQMAHSTHAMTTSSSGLHAPFRHPSLTIRTSDPIPPGDTRFSPSTDTHSVQNILSGSPHSIISPISCLPTTRRSAQVPASTSRPPTRPTPSLSPAVQRVNTPVLDFAPYKSLSPPESARIPTPVSSVLETPSVRVASSPLLGTDQLKRAREGIDVGLTDDLGSTKKRARLDDDNAEKEVNDAESDQEIEMDADGLRSITSCICELVETRAEDSEVQICRLCDIRYKNGLIPEVPKPFLRATQDDLVRHMTEEHAEAWETLRRDV
ncbi:hypothetical protein APHAL10511_001716 [Amanita phalloides]|nr:hypothetical protein APHAL10511_001716 [Amanita phalloides]